MEVTNLGKSFHFAGFLFFIVHSCVIALAVDPPDLPRSPLLQGICHQLVESVIGSRVRQRRVANLFVKGLTSQTPGLIGLHGTSIQSILQLLARGSLPVGLVRTNRLFILPFNESRDLLPPELAVEYQREVEAHPFDYDPGPAAYQHYDSAVESASNYARGMAQAHQFIEELGMDIMSNPLQVRFSHSYDHSDLRVAFPMLLGRGFIEGVLQPALTRAERMRGVLVGIGQSVRNDHALSLGDAPGEDVAITGNIELKHIVGIIPLGEEERVLFRALVHSTSQTR